MSTSSKIDAATGVITFAIAGVSGSFSATDLHEWGTTFMSLSPFVLVLYLLWRTRQLDLQHQECTSNNAKLQEQIVLSYRALQNAQIRERLPAEQDFMAGNFCLADHEHAGN